MKTRSLLFALALMITATASLVAQNPLSSLDILNQEGSSVYKIVYKSPGQNKVYLKIADESGVIYNEQMSFQEQLTFPLDFKGMKSGEYTVTVSGKKVATSKSINYTVKTPQAFVHVSKQPNDLYLLSIRSQSPSDFTVRIFDRWNREVFLAEQNDTEEFASLYNLSKVAGPFSFEVTNASGEVEVIKK